MESRGVGRVTLDVRAIALGTAVTWLLVGLALGVAAGSASRAVMVLVVSAPVAALVGGPLAWLTARLMAPVRHQGWHVAAFAGTGALAGAPVALYLTGGQPQAFAVLTVVPAACAAVGRASLWRLARREPASAPTSPPPPAERPGSQAV